MLSPRPRLVLPSPWLTHSCIELLTGISQDPERRESELRHQLQGGPDLICGGCCHLSWQLLFLGHQGQKLSDQNHILHDSLQVHRLAVGEHLVPEAADRAIPVGGRIASVGAQHEGRVPQPLTHPYFTTTLRKKPTFFLHSGRMERKMFLPPATWEWNRCATSQCPRPFHHPLPEVIIQLFQKPLSSEIKPMKGHYLEGGTTKKSRKNILGLNLDSMPTSSSPRKR